MGRNFWLQYLVSLSDRLHIVSLIVAFFFWIIGVPVMAVSFEGTLSDIVIIIAGISTTVFSTVCPTSLIIERYLTCSPNYAKTTWICDVLHSLHLFAILQVIAGGLVYLRELLSDEPLPFALVPEVLGIIGILILLFCPSDDHVKF